MKIFPTILLVTFSILCLYSCKQEDHDKIVLKILKPEVYSYGYEYEREYKDGAYITKTPQVLRYSLTNNSNITYYFNSVPWAKKEHYGINVTYTAELIIKDNNGVILEPRYWTSCMMSEEYSKFSADREKKFEQIVKDFGYEQKRYPELFLSNDNFFIHPHETLYFEGLLYLPGHHERGRIDFKKDRTYSTQLEITSDSTTFIKENTRALIKTVQANGYKVFHGTIISNKIPVVFKKD
ncbi:hypothetical protein GR160_12485 [Flavobacterium sp. Sd200]|uniref:hypothetical protein n=1 Tax=Flavobacterium sp. Sd200 TaxID=2692211 RepID=UPI00136F7D05|nr:hypothetical protein [Flavobacterium sp. Sd200]MXN92044.1 hypothetical protein [Flavobacterium sp. Sd200]